MIGQCGLTLQQWVADEVLEVGYLFRKEYWHMGYAAEGAKACMDYPFNTLGVRSVCSIIRDSNKASQRVVERNGMFLVDSWTKYYRGKDMLHFLYRKDI